MTLGPPARFFLLAFAGALLLALAERGTRALLASWRGPGVDGSWIWAAGAAPAAEPVAFYAVGEFELDAVALDAVALDAVAPGSISIAADEAYDLSLNGEALGSNSYRPGMAIDRYQVGDLVRPGRNRITVGLRSGRGAGGLLASLSIAGRTVAATGGDWRIFRRERRELFDPDSPLAGGEAPKVWQRPPTGRWRLRPAESDRPLPFVHRRGPAPNRFPVRVRIFRRDTTWKLLRRRQLRLPVRHPQVLLDWGREVTGFLCFRLESSAAAPALAYFGSEPPNPKLRPADEVLIFAAGQTAWRDAHARRFRFALLVGVPPLGRVRAWKVDPALAAELAPPPPEPDGVFGVRPPERRSAVEEEVWQRLGGR
jgi:hypothetical protein